MNNKAQICIMLLSKPTNSHLSSGNAQQFSLESPYRVANFKTHIFNYPTTFYSRIFIPSPRLPAQTS